MKQIQRGQSKKAWKGDCQKNGRANFPAPKWKQLIVNMRGGEHLWGEMDGWGIKTKRQEGEGGGEVGGGVEEGADCEEAFGCVSSHLQVRQRGEWASD